uniref:Capsid protein n=1 Tax=Alphatorquevirus homin18 TaxID=3048419 RepID=A0AAU7SSW5_9VIRU
MAWWGRWRRWRWRPRRWRRRRRRRVPRRRPQRPVRRRRARRVRRRRWGRRRWRRGYRRRLRLRRRRRRKRKIVLTQWNPAKTRRCTIKGVLPMILCGAGRSGFNYGLHSDDYTVQKPLGQNPHGGGMSTVTFSLQVLYDQYQRFMNKWSYSNDQLDLARYFGCTFYFYRHSEIDFVAQYDNVPPMKMDENTAPNTHPAFLLQNKHRVKIPSFKTKPFGRKKVRVTVGPPKLFEDKWYSQHDLCKVPLVSWRLTACDFRFPFCSPQTDNPCYTFQVLHENYYSVIGTSALQEGTNYNKDSIDTLENWLYGKCTHYQTFATDTRLNPQRPISSTNDKTYAPSGAQENIIWSSTDFQNFKKHTDSNYGYCTYCPSNSGNGTVQKIKEYRNTRFKWLTEMPATNTCHINATYARGKFKEYEYHLGWYSNIFIGNLRHNLAFKAAYLDITYNPITDKGEGNIVWFQYATKPTTEYIEAQAKCTITNIPLYAAFFGYEDYIQRTLGPYQDVETLGIICVKCPYTDPPLVNKNANKSNWGYVFYDVHFGNGKTPEGLGQVHPYWMQRWRPYVQFQKETMSKIARTGPFSYRDETPSVTLTAQYKFRFNWGGDSIFPQIIKNPCPDSGVRPGTGRERRSVQVVSPLTMGPQYIFHSWDWRRGFFNQKTLKRMLEKPVNNEEYPTGPKIPRWFPPLDHQEQENASDSEQTSSQSSQEEAAQEALQEVQETSLQQHLLQQYREQRRIGKQLQLVMLQLTKTQSNLHINPRVLGHA